MPSAPVRSWCALAVAGAAFAFASNGLAQQITVAAGDECLQGPLGPYVAVWLRDPMPPDVSVHVSIDDPRRHAVSFSVQRGSGPLAERHLVLGRAPCQDVRTALSLAVAIAIDATLLEALTGVRVETPPPPPPPPPPRARPRWAIPFDTYALFDVADTVSIGGGIGMEFGPWSWLDLRASGVLIAPGESRLGAGSVTVSGALARLDVCVRRPLTARFLLRACFGGLLGRRFAEGSGYDDSRTADVTLATLAARPEAGLVLVPRWLELRAGLDGYVFLTRPSLVVRDGNGNLVAERAFAPLGWSVSLGVALLLE